MAKRKRRKNRDRNTNKKLRFEKRSVKKGIYSIRVFADGATLRGTIVSSENGLITIKHKAPNSNQILLRKIPEEQLVIVNKESVTISGRILMAEYFATKVVRKDDKIAFITLDGDQVIVYTKDVDISAIVSIVKDEEESDDDEAEEKDEDEDDDEDEGKKKKKKKKDDEDEDEDESDDDDDDDDDKKKKKKKKSDDEDDDEDEDDKKEDGDDDDIFADL